MRSDVADTLMRMAAFGHVLKLSQIQNNISAEDLRRGFTFEGERIPLVNPQRGIFQAKANAISSFDQDGVSSSWKACLVR